jgi:hypothetical protein
VSGGFCVCVPARNEANHVGTLIDALAHQSVDRPVPLALCVNNSHDTTAQTALAATAQTAGRVELHLLECIFDPGLAHAGSARRAAMALGADLVGETGLLISTDADCRPPQDWIAANLACARPDRIVGGRIELDEGEPLAGPIASLKLRFDQYWQAVRAIEDEIDPIPWDAPPRHGDHTGASLAIGVALYRRAGGVPAIASGEDRALVDAAILAGGQLVHPPSVRTRVSARTEGRAQRGMAADMRRWLQASAGHVDLMVPAYDHWRKRATWRRRHRQQHGHARLPAAERLLDPLPCDMPLPEL